MLAEEETPRDERGRQQRMVCAFRSGWTATTANCDQTHCAGARLAGRGRGFADSIADDRADDCDAHDRAREEARGSRGFGVRENATYNVALTRFVVSL